jgi:hypothetical protein
MHDTKIAACDAKENEKTSQCMLPMEGNAQMQKERNQAICSAIYNRRNILESIICSIKRRYGAIP